MGMSNCCLSKKEEGSVNMVRLKNQKDSIFSGCRIMSEWDTATNFINLNLKIFSNDTYVSQQKNCILTKSQYHWEDVEDRRLKTI